MRAGSPRSGWLRSDADLRDRRRRGPGSAATVTRVRTVYVIGIGAGDPEHLTLQAVAAMGRVEVFLSIDKGEAKADLAGLRAELCARHARRGHRVVTAADPERDRAARDYEGAVVDWQDRRAELYGRLIAEELGADGVGGFLVWGDPAIYDGTLRILERLAARAAVGFRTVSVPGISSVQALAAAHRLILNRVGRPFLVTTGRRLARGWPPGVDDVVVMLDAADAHATVTEPGVEVYWGAYLGTPDEVLVAGDLAEVAAEITRVRAEQRARKGWIMDTYLLRRRTPQA